MIGREVVRVTHRAVSSPETHHHRSFSLSFSSRADHVVFMGVATTSLISRTRNIILSSLGDDIEKKGETAGKEIVKARQAAIAESNKGQ